eukprot:gene6393-6178_t
MPDADVQRVGLARALRLSYSPPFKACFSSDLLAEEQDRRVARAAAREAALQARWRYCGTLAGPAHVRQ